MKQQQQQQQQSFFHLLLLLLLGVYCFCDIATAIPISDGDDDDDNGAGLSLFGDILATTKGEEGDALHVDPRGGGREEQGDDLYSVSVLGKRDNNWGVDGNGNKNEEFLALNNYSPVAGGDGGGTVVGKDGDGQILELARFSSSLSPSFGGGDSSLPAPSSGNTPVKQQPSDIDPSTFRSKEEIASNPPTKSCASLAAWEARLNAREQQQNLREQKQEAMANTLEGVSDTLIKQAEDLKNMLEKKIEEDAMPLGYTCRVLTPEFPRGGI